MSPHTNRHFHDELNEVKVRLLTMSGEAETALRLAVEALLERDVDKAREVIAGDTVINDMEVQIEEACIDLLALQQPMAKDLRMLVAAIKIANDLERVGDHAVNLAESAERLTRAHPIAPEPEIVEMARLAREMLADALEAFVRGDAVAGREVCLRDDKVDALNRSVFRILLTHMMEDPHSIGTGLELLLVSRNLERVADLATNIAEDVVFLVEGKSIKHHAEDL
ncbi:MAG TPA: phosphate signaling complex protein PhoU, partial [Gemmatimonadales bacterium]|nr:phosphate signaling complex protein PhoU [Gemmatimonadales bacterium]